jgi:hypothetical protein
MTGELPRVDACLLGAGMCPGYEQYWTALQNEPDKLLPMTGKLPTPDELEYARFTAKPLRLCVIEHPASALWPKTSFLRGLKSLALLEDNDIAI